MESCDQCAKLEFDACDSVIQISTGLDSGTYELWLKDRYNDYHTQTVTVNANGDASIDLTAFDIAFTPHSGNVEISFREIGVYNIDLMLNIEGNSYDCIILSFYDKN